MSTSCTSSDTPRFGTIDLSRVQQTRVGLLGCGSIAYFYHLRILRRLPGVTLVATADPDPNARAWASRLARVPTYQRAEDLLRRDDVDAVVICVPTHLHAQLAVAAAAAGKHFYLEKPIATTLDDAQSVIAAAAQAGVTGVVGFNRRFHPLFERARAVLVRGHLGRVLAVQTAFSEPTPPNSMPEWKRCRATGGGVLLDLASHHVDLVRWLLDDEVTKATASLASDLSEHDSARVQFAMRSGVAVQSFFSFRAGLTDFLEFFGERGTLRVDRHRSRLVLRVHRRLGYGVREGWIRPSRGIVAWRLRRLIRPSVDPSYRIALSRFAEMLRGRPAQLPSLADGIASLTAILAAERSACVGPPSASN